MHPAVAELVPSTALDIAPSHCQVEKFAAVANVTGPIDSVTLADDSISTQFSDRVVKQRAGSQPLVGPILSKQSHIRSSKSDTDLSAVVAIEPIAADNGGKEDGEATLIVDPVNCTSTEISGAERLEHRTFGDETSDIAVSTSEDNENINSMLGANISDYQANPRENNTLGTERNHQVIEVNRETQHGHDHSQRFSHIEEPYHSEPANIPWSSSQGNIDQDQG